MTFASHPYCTCYKLLVTSSLVIYVEPLSNMFICYTMPPGLIFDYHQVNAHTTYFISFAFAFLSFLLSLLFLFLSLLLAFLALLALTTL